MSDGSKASYARAFIRSLNTLLRHSRFYGFDHVRSKDQLDIAWQELRSVVLADPQNGVLLSAIGTKLLLDGVDMDSGAPGRALAQMLSSAAIASVHFLPQVTLDDLSRFTKAFPAGGAKPESQQENLQEALGDKGGIRINEGRFVREDEVIPDTKLEPQLMMSSPGGDAAELKGWLNDPQKFPQLILAAEVSRGDPGASRDSRDPKETPSNVKVAEASTSVLASASVSSTAISNEILQNYASCIFSEDAETRRNAAIGIAENAELYGEGDRSLLIAALTNTGATLASERDVQIQALVSTAFVRLAQVAAALSFYPAMACASDLLNSADHQRPGLAQSLGPRLGIEEHLPNFIGRVVATGRIPAGLIELLQRVPQQAASVLASRFNECVFQDECESLVELATSIGQDVIANLEDMLARGSSTEALEAVGLLSRLDVPALEKFLPSRLVDWNQTSHDRLVRRLAAGASPERSRILSSIFEMLDPLVQPLAVDEIGMSGDETQATWLQSLADENGSSTPYLQLKVVEALNRLRVKDAIPLLKRFAETKRAWRWVHPKELRIVALQALENLDAGWVREFLPRSGILQEELTQKALDADLYSPCVRQRRYSRVRMKQPVKCETTSLGENTRLEIGGLNLCGGLATCERSLPAGTLVGLKINLGGRPARVKVFVRRTRARLMEFEIAEISLEDRTNLRRFIATSGDVAENPVLNARKRRSAIDPPSKR